MRTRRFISAAVLLMAVTLLINASFAQTKSNANNLQVEIQRLTQQWFAAYDKGDGGSMDQMEVPNLILVSADWKGGGIWRKDGPRAGKQKPTGFVSTVGDSTVRQFGDTAVLTGIVNSEER